MRLLLSASPWKRIPKPSGKCDSCECVATFQRTVLVADSDFGVAEVELACLEHRAKSIDSPHQ